MSRKRLPLGKKKSSSAPKVRFQEISSLSAITHLAQNKPHRLMQVIFRVGDVRLSPRVDELKAICDEQGVKYEIAPSKKSYDETVTALLHPFEYADLESLLLESEHYAQGMILLLDHLQDPQNFGALCRTAEALGVKAIVIPQERSVGVTPGVYQASVGACENIPICKEVNLRNAVEKLKKAGFWIIGSTLSEDSIEVQNAPQYDKVALVLGQELGGMGLHLGKACDVRVKIPLAGQVQSLNVSVAGALLMYELGRSHTKKSQ